MVLTSRVSSNSLTAHHSTWLGVYLQAAEQRLHEFEDDLRITFKALGSARLGPRFAREKTSHLFSCRYFLQLTSQALPKNGRGAVAAPSARYALHRFRLQVIQ